MSIAKRFDVSCVKIARNVEDLFRQQLRIRAGIFHRGWAVSVALDVDCRQQFLNWGRPLPVPMRFAMRGLPAYGLLSLGSIQGGGLRGRGK